MGRGLDLDVLRTGPRAIVGVHGEIDASTSASLRSRLVSLVSEGARDLVLNLTGTSYMDATGVDVIVRIFKLLSAHQGELTIVCPHEHLVKVFDAASLSDDLTIVRTPDDSRR